MKVVYSFFIFFTLLNAEVHDYDIRPSSLHTTRFMGINILDSKELRFNEPDVTEISALAYKDGKLYALGDRGFLYRFSIEIQKDKIKNISLEKTFKLKNKYLKRLKRKKRDSEGLAFKGDDLLISFERRPRVDLFSKDGIKIKSEKIYKELMDINNYEDENKALESVAYNEKYGVVTAPESPLRSNKTAAHKIYSKNSAWEVPIYGKITALEFMNSDEIMILQRYLNLFTLQRIATIGKLDLQSGKYNTLAKLDSNDNWKIDNFEGLTKIGKSRYLMISDDNDSFFQKTLIVLFEVD